MGMFDSLMIVCECPHCGEIAEREIQTKDFPDPYLARFRPGDVLPDGGKFRYVNGLASCRTDACVRAAGDVPGRGSFGMLWDVRVEVDFDGILTDRVERLKASA